MEAGYMKCPKCGNEMIPLGDGLLFDNFGREIACYCPEHQTYKIRGPAPVVKNDVATNPKVDGERP